MDIDDKTDQDAAYTGHLLHTYSAWSATKHQFPSLMLGGAVRRTVMRGAEVLPYVVGVGEVSPPRSVTRR